jgi:hypothetical protein
VFGGFRMFFAAGNREAQVNAIAGDAGYENLSPECEQIFLRAVQLAANHGEAEFCCEASAIGDPHLRGANGAKFEFGGMPNASYALLTTPAFALNMRMIAHGPQLHFIGHVGVVMRDKSLEIGPWSFQHGTAKLATYFAAIGARVVALDALRVTVELCLGHTIEISVHHINLQNYLNVHVDIPGCNDAFGGVLGGTFNCDRSQPFVWSSAMEESFRIDSLVSTVDRRAVRARRRMCRSSPASNFFQCSR